MADAATSALVKVILEKLADEAFKMYVRSQGIHSELENLGKELSQIQAVLHDASDKEIKDEAVKQWLIDLQHLAYDIDDVLDDVATEAMRRELTKESEASTSKVRNLIVPAWFTKFSLSHRLSPKIDGITIELQRLYKAKSDLGLIVKDENRKDPNRGNETSLLESCVVGREREKEKLLNKLLGDDQSSKENFSIIPIVGMGGVGKTTLARLLYNDTKVQGHFQLHVWICISDDFDIFKISKTLFQAVSGQKKEFEDLNQLQQALTEQFKDKRFLLVLDDVWTENYDHWEKLVRPLYSGAPGSRVIMTTRKIELLKMLGFDDLDLVESLSSEDALSLFAMHALGVDSFDSYPTLREKGEAIVKKCGTLPLALKAIGRLLRKKTPEKWDDVLNSKIWDSKYVGDLSADWKVIFPALMLSYHDLSANLKRLFAYCSLFPKDFLYNKEELVLLWMAEGFLNQSNATKSHEDFGQDDFEALLSRSFFQHAPNDETLYVMHDLMNDLATFVAKDFFLRFENHTESRKEAVTKYRHMSIIYEKYGVYKKFEPFKRARSLRTLLVINLGQNDRYCFNSSKFFIDLLPQVPLLRVLSLGGIDISEVPDFICSLKHLRYLNLSETLIENLPDNIGNLFNLQILMVCGCYELTKLPKSFLKLKNLRHFDFRGTASLKKLPLGIGKLKNLQTLPKIVIEEEDSGFAITELKGLNNLRGKLSIEGLCKVQSKMQAHEAQLTLKRLTKLELNWGEGSQHGTRQKEVLEELKPDSEWLKELAIKSYGGIEFPKWVGHPSFHRLVDVSISDCKNCTSLPPLGQLPSLKELYISSMPNVKFIGLEFTGTNQLTFAAFPSLEILRFEYMSSWKVWLTSNEVFDAVFPSLRKLEILYCPKLIEFSPETLPSLEILRLYMRGWKGWSINGEVSALSRLRELHIGSCSKLIELSPEKLPSLEILQFQNMLGWKIWSTNNAVFPCLGELYIADCPKLVDVSAEALPLLKVLKITRCGVGVLRSLVRAASSIAMLHMKSISGLTFEVWRGVMELLGGVEKVRIDECDEIRFLWESEEEASKVLVNIKELTVLRCFNLVSLGEKEEEDNLGGSSLSSLRMLTVSGCQKMERCFCPHSIERLDIGYCRSLTYVSFPTSATGGGQKLKSLHIRDCVNLKSIMQLGNFVYLTELYLNNCQSLESFPDLPLPLLTHLKIEKM
ncbi:putative disease resistance RPP13-like protein 1 [Helianthus annuus]|uniref:putative disease resistance RPP13-like protein 1 n=1 Tax=Helianthus annuus TaxID=4232 RepID=UPI000B8F2F2B|nr:putative disease resistance RPP13-like protein 1 [Helianthus annuus]